MGRNERAIEAQLASFREAIEAATAEPYTPPPPAPLWQGLAAGAGGFLLGLLGLAALAGILGLLAAVARIGWDMAGGVGW